MRLLWTMALLLAGPAVARTIVLDGQAADRMAAISETAPRQGWAGFERSPGRFDMVQIDLRSDSSFLIRFTLDAIPPGQRVTHAELIVPSIWVTGNAVRFHVWRLSAEWGPGVCHLYRLMRPKPVPWAVAGARRGGADRAILPSAVVPVTQAGLHVVNVTEDVALWYTGAAPAHGWLFTVEEPGHVVRLGSPAWDKIADWKLRITYEPE